MKISSKAVFFILFIFPVTLWSDNYGEVIAKTPGLVAHWRFEETLDPRLEPKEKEESLAVDQMETRGLFFPGGSTLKATVRLCDVAGGYTGRTEEVKTGQPGLTGKAFHFNGKDSLVYLFRAPELESGVDDFSVELWVKPDNLDNPVFLAERQSPLDKGNGGWFLSSANGAINFTIAGRPGKTIEVATPAKTLKPDKWQHIVVLRHESTLAVYLNGSAVTEEEDDPGFRIADYGDIVIGGTPWDRRFPGFIDEFAYYNVALPAEEIEKHFQAGTVELIQTN